MNIQKQLDEYQQYHQNKSNLIIHLIGIPMIVFSLLILLSWPSLYLPPFFNIPLSVPCTIALLIFYACYDWKTSAAALIGFLPMIAVSIALCRWQINTALITALILFILGWFLQLIGHWIEKKKPAFSDNIFHLLIGPLFIIIKIQNHFIKKKQG